MNGTPADLPESSGPELGNQSFLMIMAFMRKELVTGNV